MCEIATYELHTQTDKPYELEKPLPLQRSNAQAKTVHDYFFVLPYAVGCSR